MLTPGVLFGVLLGLGCALASSSAYLLLRRATVRHAAAEPEQPRWRGSLRMLVVAHLYLGVVCGLAELLLWPRGDSQQPADLPWALLTTIATAGFYLVGNTTLFLALRKTDASRVAPLLGFKIVLLALITHFVLGSELLGRQWLAVGLGTLAAVMLGVSGGRLPGRTVALMLGSCAGFVMSDVFIHQMVRAWLPAGLAYDAASSAQRVRASITGMALVYVWCALAGVAVLPLAKANRKQHWRMAAPYAGMWLTAMVCLFSAFALVGVVLGNILQSTRGVMSIALGVVIARRGHHHLEQYAPWPVVAQRAVAAGLMTVAIVLFVTAKEPDAAEEAGPSLPAEAAGSPPGGRIVTIVLGSGRVVRSDTDVRSSAGW